MTQARSPIGSSGSLRIVDSTQVPTARTFNGVQGSINHMVDAVEMLEITDGTLFTGTTESTTTDFVYKFTAKDNGRIQGISFANNGAAAGDSLGIFLGAVNQHDSDAVMATFGFGSATQSDSANDQDSAVDSLGGTTPYSTLDNTLTSDSHYFSKGDIIAVTADQDSAQGELVGTYMLAVSYGSQGGP